MGDLHQVGEGVNAGDEDDGLQADSGKTVKLERVPYPATLTKPTRFRFGHIVVNGERPLLVASATELIATKKDYPEPI